MSLSDWGQVLDSAIEKIDYEQLEGHEHIDVDQFKAALNEVKRNLGADHALLLEDQDTLFGDYQESFAGENGQKLANLFEKWRDGEQTPSAVSIVMFAADGFSIDEDSPNLQAAILAAVAAEISHEDNGYHDNHHFREVTAANIRLLATNEELAAKGEAGAPLLDTEAIAKSLTAAVSHDQGHDGTGNNVDGVHVPYRLEQISIDTVTPLMEMAGMAQEDVKDVATMIYVTDVSAEKGGTSPHGHMKAILESAQTGADVDLSTIPAELHDLASNPDLLQQAAMLSDADLSPSAATTYDFNQRMTVNLNKEVPFIKPGPDTTKFFCGVVVGGGFSSAAGQVQSNTAIEAKMAKAEQLIYQRDNGPKLDGNDPSSKLENNA